MGCETEVPPEDPDIEQHRVVTNPETECHTEHNRLEFVNSKMATASDTHLGAKSHGPVDVVDETLNDNKANMDDKGKKSEGQTENQEVSYINKDGLADQSGIVNTGNSDSNEAETAVANLTEKLNATVKVKSDAIENVDDPIKCYIPDEGATGGVDPSNESVRIEVLNNLEILKDRLKTATDIPSILLDVSLSCLKPSTIEYMSYHLDPQSDVMSPDDKLKDYRGMAEWIGLEPVFIKYISRSPYMLKTKEVLSKWLTLEEEPLPTLMNLRSCLLAIDRPDVLEDMSVKIALDAVTWKKTQLEAQTQAIARVEDTSWQLTRHDVVSGKKTMYTACLLYADEDELMAQVITKLYKTAYRNALFFLPQFDLKQGKYVLDTTARVIDERCDKKVIFLLSEYFYASNICQFAVNYAAAHGTGNGNLIPFHLTRNVTTVPNVLKGIAGIRWFRKGTRQHTWQVLTDCLLAEKVRSEELLDEIKGEIEKMVMKDPEYYLQDPPYDEDIAPPGSPIEVIEPPGNEMLPSPEDIEMQRIKIEEEMQRKKEKEKKAKWKLLKQIKKAICEKIIPQSVSFRRSEAKSSSATASLSREAAVPTKTAAELSPSPTTKSPMTEMMPANATETPAKPSDDSIDKLTSDEGELGACGGSDVNLTENDLNENLCLTPSKQNKNKFNICESESMVLRANSGESGLGACGGSDSSLTRNDLNDNLYLKPEPSSQNDDELNISETENMVLRAKTDNLIEKNRSTSARSNVSEYYSADLSVEDSIYSNKTLDTNGESKQTNLTVKPGFSYEMKVIKRKSDESENETLISKDVNEEVKCDAATNGLQETDALMSNYNQT
ncbi:uncharacterized protein LOC132726394 [Ruditapes philippinarum]|uniref:uncharacterized protein LOC132726394 n=1 Tax=Ruditapes philippinarum TaxID=129788 RepID=UPI00295BEB21|nr:uncharacterized protein LOC132726394 [Ruditapes philippinarum]XP_060567796.1 uncharacterized protein LOC132726394 [Ruditapes philippinarum]XP_060567868.1 uncharacterized protein LOC132726394 [Ruditapes philippinarum]XP_060567942.1 uncharacterized protein LOC132726394 [Ruditapes philippinarum]XP_060568010.1 uncharacterized protein LOC132726394 [Ruditapes philippinarum]